MSVSTRIRELRLSRGWTQKQVYEALGMAPTVYQRYEQGLRVPPLEQAAAIASLFDVSVDDLLGPSSGKADSTCLEGFGDRLRKTRLAQELTPKIIASAIGVSVASYRAYETGKHIPDLRTLIAIADALNVSLDFLAMRCDNPYFVWSDKNPGPRYPRVPTCDTEDDPAKPPADH